MPEPMTLTQVEALVVQLKPREQLQLMARISEWLTATVSFSEPVSKKATERVRRELAYEAATILRECDRAAEAFTRKTDSAETIRRIRDERPQRQWQSV